MASPSPVPVPLPSETNGRKTRSCSSGAIPGPESVTATEIVPFSWPSSSETVPPSGVQAQAAPVGRQLAEVRGLSTLTIRRLEALASHVEAERNARLDDLAVLVDLIASGYQGVEQRLDRIEERLPVSNGAWLQARG